MTDLVRRAQAGDRDAFDQLYHETVGRVYALCLRMAGDAAEAERLTQDAFVRAWENLPGFRNDSAFTSWLHRLTVNVVLMDRRSRGRRAARFELAPDIERHAGPARAAATEQRMDLERAIAALPPGARRALVLHDIEGYRHQEIADMTGTAVGTVKAQLHRARKLLREALDR